MFTDKTKMKILFKLLNELNSAMVLILESKCKYIESKHLENITASENWQQPKASLITSRAYNRKLEPRIVFLEHKLKYKHLIGQM